MSDKNLYKQSVISQTMIKFLLRYNPNNKNSFFSDDLSEKKLFSYMKFYCLH